VFVDCCGEGLGSSFGSIEALDMSLIICYQVGSRSSESTVVSERSGIGQKSSMREFPAPMRSVFQCLDRGVQQVSTEKLVMLLLEKELNAYWITNFFAALLLIFVGKSLTKDNGSRLM
jgi:hypothetical protein